MLDKINKTKFWRYFLWGIVLFFAGTNYYLYDMRRDLATFIADEAALSEQRVSSFKAVREAPKILPSAKFPSIK